MNISNRIQNLEQLFCLFKEKMNKKVQSIQNKLQQILLTAQQLNNNNTRSSKTEKNQKNISVNQNNLSKCQIVVLPSKGDNILQYELDQIKQLKKRIQELDQIDFILDQYVQKETYENQINHITKNFSKLAQQMQSKFKIQNLIIQSLSKELKQHVKTGQIIDQKLNLLENKVQTQSKTIQKENQSIKLLKDKKQAQKTQLEAIQQKLKHIQILTTTVQQKCKQNLSKQQKCVQNIYKQQNEHKQTMNSHLKQVQQKIQQKEKSINLLNEQQKASKQQSSKRLTKIEQQLLILQKEQNGQIENVLTSFKKCLAFIQTMQTKSKQTIMKWSQQLKATDIKITGSVAEKANSNGGRFALIGPCLPFNHTKTCWAIQINKLNYPVYVGISLKNIIAKENFLFMDADKIGHGHYVIGSSSWTHSHSDVNYNFVNKSFGFVAGDTIFMEFDSANRILRFRRNRLQQKFQLDVVAPVNDSYYPSVELCGVGDSVSLVDGQPLS